ncbi:MAG: efflux RND transporter periplasmic adaptor subunit [Bacteroidales bacterium]|nr:efflux RND transporter periplasmic adaptor subunit [Bacteroidales bacterium]
MKKFAGYLIAALLVAGMVFILFNNRRKIAEKTAQISMDSIVSVETLTLEQEDYTLEFSTNGTTMPVRELKMVSDVSGRVVKIFVDNGTRVKAGTPLLEIDKELLQSDYEASKAAYESLQKNVERFSSSNELGGVSDQQLESLEAQLVAAKSRYEVSRRRLADATVKAPIAGIVNMRYVETGSLIAPAAPLFDIVDNSRLKLMCNLPENRIVYVRTGQKVTLVSNGNGEALEGRVNFIGLKSDRGMNYPVEVMIENSGDLRAGMFLKAVFSAEEGGKGILVPRSAIVGGLHSSMVYVYSNGKAAEREVSLGEMVGDKVEVLSGLGPGETIIVSGIMNITDGTEVKPVNQAI